MTRRPGLILTLVTILASACSSASSADSGTGPVILASTTFLADIAQNVAGDRAHIAAFIPVGVDPHAYQPTPQDIARLTEADIIIFNGAGYDTFYRPLLENSGNKGWTIEAAAGLWSGDEVDVDPHFWLDPNNVMVYVENIRAGLAEFDPAGAAAYRSNAEGYLAQLRALDAWITDEVSQIPPGKRLLVTNHESLGHFAERYGFTVVGTVVESFSSDASPSAQQMASLVDQINATGAPAIFLDAADNPTLASQAAAETGVTVIDDLHLESLTAGAPAATYIEMMKHNVTRIVDALK